MRGLLTGLGAAAAVGIALKEASNGNGPNDMLAKVKAVTKSLGNFLGHDLGATKQTASLAGNVLQASTPVGKALTEALMQGAGMLAVLDPAVRPAVDIPILFGEACVLLTCAV